MCLGAGARARNKARKNAYIREDQERVADAMGKISTTKTKQVDYNVALNESGLELSKVYASADLEMAKANDAAIRKNENAFIQYLENSIGEKMAASGQTGRSTDRISTIELGRYFAQGSRDMKLLTESQYAMQFKKEEARRKASNYEDRLFADVMNVDVFRRPPMKPVYENVGLAMLTDGLSIASSVVGLWPS